MGLGVEVFSALVLVVILPFCVTELVDISPYHSSIIDRHNEMRREVGAADMQAIEWDEGLAKQAEEWTKYCRYERAPSHMFDCGQNLFYTNRYVHSWSNIDRAIKRAIKTWKSEKDYYTYGTDCGSSCSYVQAIFSTAGRIGCGMNRCPVMKAGDYKYRRTLFACFYNPKSFITSDFPYTPGIPCSRCPIGMGCEGGLCVPAASLRVPANLIDGPEVAPKSPHINNIPERIPVQQPTQPPVVSPMCIPMMTSNEVHYLLTVTNRLRARDALLEVAWSEELEQWAQYVIRCDIEYPGPRTAYTNFGKCDASLPLYQVMYQWGDEGIDTSIALMNGGCRTPGDVAQCNHNTNLMASTNTRMGCAACLCGLQRQLTCIFDSK